MSLSGVKSNPLTGIVLSLARRVVSQREAGEAYHETLIELCHAVKAETEWKSVSWLPGAVAQIRAGLLFTQVKQETSKCAHW